jgi:hypothetical protein
MREVGVIKEEPRMPEITDEARRVMLLITVASVVAFLLLVWVFAFYM